MLKVEGQDYNKLCKRALLINKANKQYSYASKTDSIYITYLGEIATITNKQYKIISIKNVWGTNKHTNGYIWIYDAYNKYVGRYVLGDARDLPVRLKNNLLFFSNKNKDCKIEVQTKINFRLGLPQKVFIPACGEYGDVYEFSK